MLKFRLFSVFCVVLIFSLNVSAQDKIVNTQVDVLDGDTIIIKGEKIRLEGIDAPEYPQMCRDANNKRYPCGVWSSFALKDLIGNKVVNCENSGRDQYGRILAICYVEGININRWMVENGWAIIYDRYYKQEFGYREAEKKAKAEKLGVWQGKFMKPELYRVLNKDWKPISIKGSKD